MRLHIALTQAPLSILNYHLIRVVSVCKELCGDTKNYQKLTGNFGKTAACAKAYDSFRIGCDQSSLGRDPSASLRLTNSGDRDCVLRASSRKIL